MRVSIKRLPEQAPVPSEERRVPADDGGYQVSANPFGLQLVQVVHPVLGDDEDSLLWANDFKKTAGILASVQRQIVNVVHFGMVTV